MKTLARFCYQRRRLVLLAWLAGLIAVMFVGFGFGAPADNNFSGGKSDSGQAQSLLDDHFPQSKGDTLTLAIHHQGGVGDPAFKAATAALLGTLGRQPHVTSVSSPYTVPGQTAPDGRTAFARIQFDLTADKVPMDEAKHIVSVVKAAGPSYAVTGGSVGQAETPYSGGAGDGIGVGAALVILLVSFGSLVAAGLPVLIGVAGVGAGVALTMLIGYLAPAPAFSPIISAMLGLGVGIDYALFIITRFREGLEDGLDPEEATVASVATAGRAVLFAGTTVVIAMLGLFVMQQRLLNATAVAAATTVLMTMLAAITLLPAMLGFAGRSINRLKIPYLGRTRVNSPLAERWSRVIQRRPVIAAVIATGIMLVLAIPALSMRLSFEDNSTLPHSTSSYQAHRILSDGFGPGYDAPLIVVAKSSADGLAPVRAAVAKAANIASATPVIASPDRRAAMFIAYPKTTELSARTSRTVHDLRDTVIPASAHGLDVHVGGPNAGTIDFSDVVNSRLPWLIAVVIGLALVLLVVLVRSVVIAVKAALMTLLSVVVSYGVLTAVVQWGWGGTHIGFTEAQPITTWVPLFVFPILFGLSTDYEVFLISRVRELYDETGDTRQAVTTGLARTARVITAAACIMIAVFLAVFAGQDAAVKEFGLALAIAVLVDATVVRMVLVPALMEILGEANWWLPRPLARLLPAES